jgi:transposase
MIAASAGVKVMVATTPVDFRKGADGLAALVREQLRHDPFSGTIFVFRSKRADRLQRANQVLKAAAEKERQPVPH